MELHAEDDMSLDEEAGSDIALRVRQRVSGLDKNVSPGMRLWQLKSWVGIPAVNSHPPEFPGLRLVKRSFEFLKGRNDQGVVTLDYVRYGGVDDYNFIFRGGTSLSQVTTQKDIHGANVEVSYTYPEGHPKAGTTEAQPADVPVFLPQSTLTATGIMTANDPTAISRLWTGAINATPWASAAPYQWLCQACDWEPLDITTNPRTYRYTFTFQLNLEGWKPTVFWRDPETQKRPIDLVPGVGIKLVDWYTEINFFNTPPYFQGR